MSCISQNPTSKAFQSKVKCKPNMMKHDSRQFFITQTWNAWVCSRKKHEKWNEIILHYKKIMPSQAKHTYLNNFCFIVMMTFNITQLWSVCHKFTSLIFVILVVIFKSEFWVVCNGALMLPKYDLCTVTMFMTRNKMKII